MVLVGSAQSVFADKYNKRSGAKVTLADLAEGDYDIKHLRFNLSVTDTSTYIKGDVITTAQVVVASMSNYVFELDPVLTIDSVRVNGTLLTVATSGIIRTITLPIALTSGAVFTAHIYYHGTPPSGSGFFHGVTHSVSAYGTHMIYTVSDPWVAKDWWPSKQSVNDKIDSVDMFVTVPRNVVDGSNGVLVNIDSVSSPGYYKYHWKTNYPIAYYLISIAVAKYAEDRSYMHFSGSGDSMLVQNFFMDTATFYPAHKARFDSIGLIVDYFSSLFGRYPFWLEKYGVCFTTLSGGMENQTMTTIGVTDTRTIAHELAHQWFGDNVTYSRWGEVWLSEGFATHSESLFKTQFWGPAAGLASRQGHLSNATTSTEFCGQVFVTDTSGPTTIFHRATVYDKAAMVVSMLRYIAPEDSLFFRVLRLYQQNHNMGNAATTDLQAIAEAEYGIDLDTFFNQWIYGKGFPRYRVSWDQVGTNTIVKLIQMPSCPASTPRFSTPLELQLHAASADTFIKVYNNSDTQVYVFDWPQAVSSIYFNPNAYVLCTRFGTIVQDTMLRYTVGVGNVKSYDIKIFPNPSKNYWQVDNLPDDSVLTLTDINGRELWRGRSTNGSAIIPGADIPAGNYLLKVGEGAASIKLVHW
jgi:aminopeptidase N